MDANIKTENQETPEIKPDTTSNDDFKIILPADPKLNECISGITQTELNYEINNEKKIQDLATISNEQTDALLFQNLEKDFVNSSQINNDIITEILENKANSNYDEVENLRKSIEDQMSIFDDKNTNTIDLNERDEYIRKNFDLDIFLKLHSKASETTNLLNNVDLFFNMDNENMLYFLTLIRDKVNNLYIDFLKPVQDKIELANEIIRNNINVSTAPKEEAWAIFKNYLSKLAPTFVEFAKELPGLDRFCQHDFCKIVDINFPVFYGFLNTKLYINNELYLVLENTRIDRNAFEQFFGTLLCFSIFEFHECLNNLNLTNQETALLFPFILTSTGEI